MDTFVTDAELSTVDDFVDSLLARARRHGQSCFDLTHLHLAVQELKMRREHERLRRKPTRPDWRKTLRSPKCWFLHNWTLWSLFGTSGTQVRSCYRCKRLQWKHPSG
jgi:hypothetical protein